MAHRNGYAYEHRIIMAKSLGRPLTRREVVHHINKKKLDNRLENLKLCASRRAHKELHRLMRGMRKEGEPNPRIVCACGCGEALEKFDSTDRPRKFIHGHTGVGRFKYDRTERATCECGCGTVFLKRDKSCRIRHFVRGHGGRKQNASL